MWLKPKKENVVENNKETKNLVTIKCPGEMVPKKRFNLVTITWNFQECNFRLKKKSDFCNCFGVTKF